MCCEQKGHHRCKRAVLVPSYRWQRSGVGSVPLANCQLPERVGHHGTASGQHQVESGHHAQMHSADLRAICS